jgi:thiosulfate dehydrogenase [quinone] large subunit
MYGTKALAALRVTLGVGFLYAGLEKIFDFAGTGAFTAAGFLKFGTIGALPGVDPKTIVNPTHALWVNLAGYEQLMPVLNWLVVTGETAIGIALILGIAVRLSGVLGAVLMGLITVAAWSFGFGPINETVLYAVVALYLAAVNAGRVYGVDGWLERTEFVTRTPALHYLV